MKGIDQDWRRDWKYINCNYNKRKMKELHPFLDTGSTSTATTANAKTKELYSFPDTSVAMPTEPDNVGLERKQKEELG